MEVTCKTVNTELRPVVCTFRMPLGSHVVGFQNSIPCKEEFKDASFGLFQYGMNREHSVCRSNEDKDTVAVVIEGDKLHMAGTGSMVPKDQKCVC